MKKRIFLFGLVLAVIFTVALSLASCGEHEHEWSQWVVTKQGSCMEKGSRFHTCYVCGEQETQRFDGEGHTYGEWKVSAGSSCDDRGYQTRSCQICGHEQTELSNQMGIHSWGPWMVDSPATCENPGSKKHICTECGDAKWEIIPATGHSYSEEWTHNDTEHWHEATCEHTDLVSDKQIHILEPALGKHTTFATCEGTGIFSIPCKDCDYVREDVTDPTDHNPQEGAWKHDITGHWLECRNRDQNTTLKCDVKVDYAAHTYNDENRCTVCYFAPTLDDIFTFERIGTTAYRVTGAILPLEHLIIPATYGDLPVTEIASEAFKGVTSLKKVTVPEGIGTIGSYAFDGCTNLERITLPEGLANVGIYLFAECEKLDGVTLPSTLHELPRGTFYGCSSLTSIVIPNGVTVIEMMTFFGCASLSEVTIPNTVSLISTASFDGCQSLKTLVIPQGVRRIEANAFKNCALESVTFILPEDALLWAKAENGVENAPNTPVDITSPAKTAAELMLENYYFYLI